MSRRPTIQLNGLAHEVSSSPDTPLLSVLQNELHLYGPRFGCGPDQCRGSSMLLDGTEIRSCPTPIAAVTGKSITTLEVVPELWASQRGGAGAVPVLHPLQQARLHVQVQHCGYCQHGMLIHSADLLSPTKAPSGDRIRTASNGHLCRRETYPRILTGIWQGASVLAKADA
jgi:isoquinoline 1-oxidoreductase subunit alpha